MLSSHLINVSGLNVVGSHQAQLTGEEPLNGLGLTNLDGVVHSEEGDLAEGGVEASSSLDDVEFRPLECREVSRDPKREAEAIILKRCLRDCEQESAGLG